MGEGKTVQRSRSANPRGMKLWAEDNQVRNPFFQQLTLKPLEGGVITDKTSMCNTAKVNICGRSAKSGADIVNMGRAG